MTSSTIAFCSPVPTDRHAQEDRASADGVFDETDVFEWGDTTTMFEFRGLKMALQGRS